MNKIKNTGRKIHTQKIPLNVIGTKMKYYKNEIIRLNKLSK